MSKQVQQFITRVNRMIKEDGLTGISGVRFDRGGKPMDVLKAKAAPYPMFGVAGSSVGRVAEAMNGMFDEQLIAENKATFRKRRSNGTDRWIRTMIQANPNPSMPVPQPIPEGLVGTMKAFDEIELTDEEKAVIAHARRTGRPWSDY